MPSRQRRSLHRARPTGGDTTASPKSAQETRTRGTTTPLTQHQNAPKWLNARLELAQALASGKYVQQPPSQQKTPLRDTQGRYTIDGVAADLSPIIWTLIEGRWRAVWIDELSGTSALEKAKNGAITGLTPDEEAQLIRQGAGEETSLPEVTACYLGLHDSNGHAAILMIHPDAVPTALAKVINDN